LVLVGRMSQSRFDGIFSFIGVNFLLHPNFSQSRNLKHSSIHILPLNGASQRCLIRELMLTIKKNFQIFVHTKNLLLLRN